MSAAFSRTPSPLMLPHTQGICNLLADRQQRVRDDARVVLVSVAKELGPAYMPYICNVLRCVRATAWCALTRSVAFPTNLASSFFQLVNSFY